jgi:hypothetical protein
MSTTSTSALGRSYRAERTLSTAIGLLALLAGATAIVLGLDWLGTSRATLPVLDPTVMDWLDRHQPAPRIGAISLGVLLLVLGLVCFFRSLRPEARPDLELDHTAGKGLTVTAGAIAHAVQADVERIDGVSRARARIVGDRQHPALRLSLWLREDSDVKAVWHELNSVLGRTRECLGLSALPTAVLMELAAERRQLR